MSLSKIDINNEKSTTLHFDIWIWPHRRHRRACGQRGQLARVAPSAHGLSFVHLLLQALSKAVGFTQQLLQTQHDQAKAALANYDLVARGLLEEQVQLAMARSKLELLSDQQALDDLYDNAQLMAALTLQEIARVDKAIDCQI